MFLKNDDWTKILSNLFNYTLTSILFLIRWTSQFPISSSRPVLNDVLAPLKEICWFNFISFPPTFEREIRIIKEWTLPLICLLECGFRAVANFPELLALQGLRYNDCASKRKMVNFAFDWNTFVGFMLKEKRRRRKRKFHSCLCCVLKAYKRRR